MATKRQVTLRFRDEYVRASKKQKGVILDRMCETLGIGRSTARRLLAQAGQHGNGAVPAARERPCRYSDQSRQLLVRVWVLMDMPCGKYLKAMLPQWLPVLRDCGELDAYDGFTFSELMAMSASTIDRYLKPLRDAAHPKGLAATRPAGELLRNSITIRKASDELDGLPGNVEADTVIGAGRSLHTEVERRTRFLMAAIVPDETAAASVAAQEAMFSRLPAAARTGVTHDDGTEFARHAELRDELGMATYFADPYSSWQRGGNENRNGMIRRYLPKRTPIAPSMSRELQEIVDETDNRPMRVLGYRTPPAEAFADELLRGASFESERETGSGASLEVSAKS